MRKILITGKNSFIGNAFEKRASLFDGQYSVEKLSLRSEDWKDTDFSKYDCVLHVAGLAHVKYSQDLTNAYMAINRDLAIEAARKAKRDGVKQFVLMSSMIVYGAPAKAGKTRFITKDTDPAPENAYGLSKIEAEDAIKKLQDENFTVSIVRSPTVYGKGCKGNYMTLSKYAKLLKLFPDFGGLRSVIYVENLAEFIRIIIDEELAGVFFPQNSEFETTADIMRAIVRKKGYKTLFTKAFNPAIMLLSSLDPVRKAFGGIAYEKSMSNIAFDYNVRTFEESISLTEE